MPMCARRPWAVSSPRQAFPVSSPRRGSLWRTTTHGRPAPPYQHLLAPTVEKRQAGYLHSIVLGSVAPSSAAASARPRARRVTLCKAVGPAAQAHASRLMATSWVGRLLWAFMGDGVRACMQALSSGRFFRNRVDQLASCPDAYRGDPEDCARHQQEWCHWQACRRHALLRGVPCRRQAADKATPRRVPKEHHGDRRAQALDCSDPDIEAGGVSNISRLCRPTSRPSPGCYRRGGSLPADGRPHARRGGLQRADQVAPVGYEHRPGHVAGRIGA
jgi:hypothetical protein